MNEQLEEALKNWSWQLTDQVERLSNCHGLDTSLLREDLKFLHESLATVKQQTPPSDNAGARGKEE